MCGIRSFTPPTDRSGTPPTDLAGAFRIHHAVAVEEKHRLFHGRPGNATGAVKRHHAAETIRRKLGKLRDRRRRD